MILFNEALDIVLSSYTKLPGEKIPLAISRGRVLIEDIFSDVDIPPFNKSAMDGYAARSDDLNNPLKIIENIPAGYVPKKRIEPLECSKIMTGAMVPDGADCVVMIENTKEVNGKIIVEKKSENKNICKKAEDIAAGELVLKKGSLITPVEIAILATVGIDPVPVSSKPIVGVIATGSELVEPSQKPNAGQIRNSNSYQLCAQIERAGCIPHYYGIAKDSKDVINNTLKKAMCDCNIIILSGGVSMGDYDFVPKILMQNNVRLLFEKIAVKPGKPTVFGTNGKIYFFGLPGNPVSTLIQFELLVRPHLAKMMGYAYRPNTIMAKLKKRLKRRKAKRMEFIPVILTKDGFAEPLEYHGSGHMHAYYGANGVIAIEREIVEINEGANIEVMLLNS